ncbi:hypothetical protein Tco_0468290 [Tanacetum coccineum]
MHQIYSNKTSHTHKAAETRLSKEQEQSEIIVHGVNKIKLFGGGLNGAHNSYGEYGRGDRSPQRGRISWKYNGGSIAAYRKQGRQRKGMVLVSRVKAAVVASRDRAAFEARIKDICASRFVLVYPRLQEHQYITGLDATMKLPADKATTREDVDSVSKKYAILLFNQVNNFRLAVSGNESNGIDQNWNFCGAGMGHMCYGLLI